MIKKFNFLLKNTNLLKAYFTQSTTSFQSQKACKQKTPIYSFKNLKAAIQYDTSNQFFNYPFINHQFQTLIKLHSQQLKKIQQHSKEQNEHFQKSLKALINYPSFDFDKESLKIFYQIILQNIHAKEPSLLQSALTLMIMSDNYVQQTKLYEQFARFYVNSPLQVIKSRFSLNLLDENIIGSIKKLLMSIYQRGFFPRTPGYIRNLYITKHVLILSKMIQKEQFYNSLMLKRVFYEYFMQIKQFYQSQMKQNLYHEKNIVLLQKSISIIKVLCISFEKKIQIIQMQSKQLRQLYIKLFMVIDKPNLTNSIFMYKLIKNQFIQSQRTNEIQQKETNEIKQKQINININNNNIYNNKNQTKNLQQQYQQIQKVNKNDYIDNILSQFVIKVKQEFDCIQCRKQVEIQSGENNDSVEKQFYIDNFTIEQILCILSLQKDLKLKPKFIQQYTNIIIKRTSPLLLNLHLQPLINLLSDTWTQLKNLIIIFTKIKSYQLLTLQQIAQLATSIIVKQNNLVKSTILQHITTIDIKEVGTKQILYLLKVYQGTKVTEKQNNPINIDSQQVKIQQHRIPIINFILRFLADHHNSLQLDSYFQQILEILFNLKQNQQKNKNNNQCCQQNLLSYNFNDSNDNYPMTILHEMYEFLNKNTWKIKNKPLKNIIKQKLLQLK